MIILYIHVYQIYHHLSKYSSIYCPTWIIFFIWSREFHVYADQWNMTQILLRCWCHKMKSFTTISFSFESTRKLRIFFHFVFYTDRLLKISHHFTPCLKRVLQLIRSALWAMKKYFSRERSFSHFNKLLFCTFLNCCFFFSNDLLFRAQSHSNSTWKWTLKPKSSSQTMHLPFPLFTIVTVKVRKSLIFTFNS